MADDDFYVPDFAGGYAGSDTPSPTPQSDQAPTASDHMNYLDNVFHNSMAGLHVASSLISPDDETTKYNSQEADYHRAAALDAFNDMSPAGKEAATGWNRHYLHGALFGIEQQIPGLVAGVGGGAVGGPVGAALGLGAIGATDFAGSAASAIKQMTPEQKAEKFPDYSILRQTMTDEDATNQTIRSQIPTGMLEAGAASAAMGVLPGVGGSVAGRLAIGAGTGVAGNAISNLALTGATGGTPGVSDLTSGIVEQGLMGAGFGLMGHGERGPARGEPVSDTSGTGVGSGRQGRKVDAILKPLGKGTTTDTNTGAPLPPDIMDPAQRAAAEATLGVRQSTGKSSTIADGEIAGKAAELRPVQEAPTPQTPPEKPPAGNVVEPVAPPTAPPLTAPPERATVPTPPVRSPSVPDLSAPGAKEAPTPQSIAQPQPAPSPVDPRGIPDTGVPTDAVTERPETLQLQQEALLNGQKELVYYPQSKGLIELPSGTKGIKQRQLPNGDAVQFRSDGPNKLTYAKIHDAQKLGKLNDILGLGPVSREEATARSAAGETPAAVVERTPEGTEARAGATTVEAAPETTEAMEQTKLAPENKLGVEPGEKPIAERLAPAAKTAETDTKLAELKKKINERIAAGQPYDDLMQQKVTAPSRVDVEPPRRVLEDLTPEDKARQEAFKKGVQERAKQIVEPTPEPAHRPSEKVQKRLDNNAIGDRVFEANKEGHPQDGLALDPEQAGGKGARTRLLARVKSAVEQATKDGFEVPGAIRKNVDPQMNHSLGSIWLNEASKLVNRAKAGKAGTEDYARFLKREEMARNGDREGILQDRINEAKEKKEPKAEVKEEAIETRGEEATPGVKEDTAEQAEIDEEAAYQRAHEAKEQARMAARRAESETIKKEAEEGAKERERILDARRKEVIENNSSVEPYMKPGYPLYDNPPYTKAEQAKIGEFFTPTKKEPPKVETLKRRTMVKRQEMPTTVREGLAGTGRLGDQLSNLIGDMPVYYLSHDEMTEAAGTPSYGMYDPENERIAINSDNFRPDTLLHEAYHAATAKGIDASPELQKLMGRLRDELGGKHDPEEFLTRLNTDPNLRAQMKGKMLSSELSRDIGVPKWRKQTLWEGALNIFRRALGMGPRDLNALEAAYELGQRAMAMPEEQPITPTGKLLQRVEDETPVDAAASPGRYSKSMDAVTDNVKNTIRNVPFAARTVTETMRKLIDTPRDWMERAKERKWAIASPAEKIIDRMGQLGADRAKILKLSNPIMDGLGRLYNEDGEEFHKLAKLFVSSTIHGADARDDLGEGLNKHIKVNETNPENSNIDHWEAIKGHPDDAREYSELKPDTQDLYNDTMDELREMNTREITATRDALSDKLQREMRASSVPQELKDAVNKVINKEELTADEEKLYGKDDNIKAIRSYDAMTRRSQLGAYFPLTRDEGTHVVTGEYQYNKPTGATRLSTDKESPDYHTLVFPDRKSAFDFEPGAPSSTEIKHYIEDPTGGREYVSADEATTTPEVKHGQEFHVKVNPRDMRIVNGNIEGERMRRVMEREGLKNISQVQPRKNQEVWQHGINSTHVNSIIKRLDKMDNITDTERARLADAVKHVAASSMPGSRLSRAVLHRDRTGGAGQDIIQTLDRYRIASAGREAMAKHRDEIDTALDSMKNYVDKNPGHEDAGAMRQMVNAYDDRVNNFQKDALNDMSVNKRWNAIRAYTTLNDLVSPGFFLLHQLHIPLTVFPDVAARHGIGKAARITLGVYKDMLGKELPMAGKAIGRAFTQSWKYDHKPTDFIDALKNEGNMSADERKGIEWGMDHDFVHGTGIDFSQAHVSASTLTKMTSKMRNFSQEFIGSADAFNRVNSFLMYHRAALEDGIKGEEAYRYAWDRVAATQGQFTSFQRMGMFRDPRMQSLLQYKQFPILMTKMIAKAMYNSFAPGVEWETRARALRTFGLMSLSAGAMSGVEGGTAYPLRLTDDLLSLMGLTDGWEAHMDELRRGLYNQMGSTGATALMDGMGGLAGMYAGHRGGISDPLGINYLLETSKGDQDMYKYLAGPPGGLAHNLISGLGAGMQGDPVGMLKNLLPRVIGDPIKAYSEYSQGVTTQRGAVISPPVGGYESTLKALGLVPIEDTHAREARAAVGREKAQQQTERQRIEGMWKSGDRAGAIAAVHQFNIANPGQHITVASLGRAQKPTVLGYPETPRNRADLEARARAYGLQ